MFISEKSIQQVRDASISEIIGHYIKLDRNGKACCPFHNEKTPSFKVTESKGIYYCFGCGVTGDGIRFVQEHDKLGFYEAIERIASLCHFTLEYEEVADKEKFEVEKANREKLKEVLQFTVTRYRENLLNLPADHPVSIYLEDRKISKDLIIEWQLGWSTEEWQHISSDLVNRNMYEPASQLGIIKRTSDDRNYDGYRSRITIPIMNRYGEYIGLAGRFFEIDPADKNKNAPKYINPPQNELYDKSQVLFGLNKADRAINNEGYAFLVEGYFDVITMHAGEEENTIGSCGTALTHKMALLIKKYTSHVVVFRDGDGAGRAAAVKDIFILTETGLKTEIALLPDGEDPDSYKRKSVNKLYQDPTLQIQDGILWYTESLLQNVFDDSYKLGQAQNQIIDFLLKIPNDIYRSNYFDAIVKKYKWKKTSLEKQMLAIQERNKEKAETDDDGASAMDKMPKWMNRQEFLTNGYCVVNNTKRVGYYFMTGENYTQVTNFIIKPLFHVYAGKDSRHLIQIDNGYKKAVIDIESKALVNKDLFHSFLIPEGAFIIYGSNFHLQRIATQLLSSFPRCLEVKFLGWQPYGFFAFVDKVYVPGEPLHELDEWGIYKHQDKNHLIPASSAAYREVQQSGNDEHEHDRVLQWRPSKVSFSDWATLMHRVYREKGIVGIAYTILTLFRDIVFEIDNNCPHLYGYGERSSGKSKWAESICSVFYKKRAAFPLNSGTDHSFFSYMQRFINCPSFLNEFDKEIIRPEWFQAIKGVFDGEGRQRGVMGSRSKIEVMKVRSTLLLMGQYLNTADDNSIVSRSIIQDFHEVDRNDDDKKEFDRLKEIEDNGLSHLIIEVLQHRTFVKENYRLQFNEKLGEWRRSITDTTVFNQRIMQNWCHLYTGWFMLSDKITLPIPNQQFEAYCKKQGLRWSKFIRTQDTLGQFWEMLSFLVDQRMVNEGWDYKIKEEMSVRIRKGKDDFTTQFNEPTKVLYLRLNNVHKLYEKEYKMRTGQAGMTIENLKHYFEGRKYFLGNNASGRFSRFVYKDDKVTMPGTLGSLGATRVETSKQEEAQISSSYMFIYQELGIEIERINPIDEGVYLNGQQVPIDQQTTELPF